jgi:hypothetical protein
MSDQQEIKLWRAIWFVVELAHAGVETMELREPEDLGGSAPRAQVQYQARQDFRDLASQIQARDPARPHDEVVRNPSQERIDEAQRSAETGGSSLKQLGEALEKLDELVEHVVEMLEEKEKRDHDLPPDGPSDRERFEQLLARQEGERTEHDKLMSHREGVLEKRDANAPQERRDQNRQNFDDAVKRLDQALADRQEGELEQFAEQLEDKLQQEQQLQQQDQGQQEQQRQQEEQRRQQEEQRRQQEQQRDGR